MAHFLIVEPLRPSICTVNFSPAQLVMISIGAPNGSVESPNWVQVYTQQLSNV